ncbi:unnamed protein product [Caenorhabditis angaria]|uniref:Uncharacterized protein n=1 Tax=Caenorhabditis angaria TaxID=860376 RepID=A0A9P1MW47_9PELO|nr:unnamed protein product [Caenorhabditis angaria]
MLLQRIGIEHLRICFIFCLFSIAHSTSHYTFQRHSRSNSNLADLFSDYDDTPADAESAFNDMSILCANRQKSSGSKNSLLDALCSNVPKKQ